jgi:DNA-directed RNA polymerase subunit RPC12/RpoP
MKFRVISRPYEEKCPACGKKITIIVPGGENRGEYLCKHCGAVFEWDRSEDTEKEAEAR